MRIQLSIHDVTPEELPEVIAALGEAHVSSLGVRMGRFNVTSNWNEDRNDPAHPGEAARWTSIEMTELHRLMARLHATEPA